MIAYLTICLSLSRHICMYPLDFGVFYCFVHRVKLKIYSKNISKMRHFNMEMKKNFLGGECPRPSPLSCGEGIPSPHPISLGACGASTFAPSALHLPLQMQFLDPPMPLNNKLCNNLTV